jgi:hypothetical protein
MRSVSLKVESFTSWIDPCNNKIKHCSFLVKLKDLPNQSILPIEPINTRKQDIGSVVARGIISSAKLEPNIFHLKGKGMTLYARNFEFKSGRLSLFLSKNDGLGDGAHSFLSSLEAVKQTRGDIDSYISVTVISGLDEPAQKKSSLYRNTSIANKELTKHNYRGDFDSLKNSIKNETYSDLVSYVENDNKEINSRWLVSMLSLFVYNDKKQKDCISRREKVLNDFVLSQKNLKKEYFSITGVAPEIFSLYDLICSELEKTHLKKMDPACDNIFKEKSRLVRTFSRKKCLYDISDCIVFPILASFRSNIVWDGLKFCIKNKDQIRSSIKKKSGIYYNLVARNLRNSGFNEYRLISDPEFWKSF